MFAPKAAYPLAVLLFPVVTAPKAVIPTATLYSAVLVDDEGSFPMYNELSSTNASLKPVTFDAPALSICVCIFEVTLSKYPISVLVILDDMIFPLELEIRAVLFETPYPSA